MSYLSPIPSHWVHSVHPSTNVSTRPPSPDHPRGVRPTLNSHPNNNNNLYNPTANEQQLRNDAIERSHRYNTRSAHLPFRGVYNQRHRVIRAINARPTVASTVDADEVSDEEIALDNRKAAISRFGHKSIVAIGRRKTAYEEELSADEDNHRRSGYASSATSDSSSSLGGEGGPGAFVGGHTGHAAAAAAVARNDLAASRLAETRAEEALRNAQAERDRIQAELDRMIRERGRVSDAAANANQPEMMDEGDRDLDADIEDLD